MAKVCQHCRKKRANRPRCLCWDCFYANGVRDLYPPKVNGVTGDKVRRGRKEEDPTEAELDAMIAEQLPTMPEDGRRFPKRPRWTPPVIHCPHRVTMMKRALSHAYLL